VSSVNECVLRVDGNMAHSASARSMCGADLPPSFMTLGMGAHCTVGDNICIGD
jgi:hypothetical protein